MGFSDSTKLKIGVLAPNSNFVPFLASDMLAALELGLAEARLDAEIVVGAAGYNADVRMVAPAIQQLMLANRVDCILAPLNAAVIERVSGYCESQRIPLIALNLTEDPLFESARNPFVFVNSFYLWHSAWMSGYLAGQKFGSRGAIITALHDGGYGLAFAFQLGLEAAQGTCLHVTVTHRNSSSEDPTKSINEITAQRPDFIWAAYSGKEAISFLKAYSLLNQENKIPVVALPPIVNENVRRNAEKHLRGIWYLSGESFKNDENPLTVALGREPNPYAVLAYEAAHLIGDAAKRAQECEKSLNECFWQSLSSAEYPSFRGAVGFNRNLKENAQFYLHHIVDDDKIVETVTAPTLLCEQYQLACQKLTKQGWLNPYLCG